MRKTQPLTYQKTWCLLQTGRQRRRCHHHKASNNIRKKKKRKKKIKSPKQASYMYRISIHCTEINSNYHMKIKKKKRIGRRRHQKLRGKSGNHLGEFNHKQSKVPSNNLCMHKKTVSTAMNGYCDGSHSQWRVLTMQINI